MSIKIKKIKIKAVRGIPELELDLNGKSLLLKGENGTGKSSIVDAVEFFFTGKIKHLEGIRELSLRRHGPHVNFTPDDVNVEITFDPGNISLSRNFTSAPNPSTQLKSYFQITQKGAFILRRSQILEFIVSKPADRFRAIGNIIGIESLDNIELEMMRLRDELNGKVISKKEKIKELFNDLSTTIEKDITNLEDVVPELNNILRGANLPLIKSLGNIDKHAEEMLKTTKKTRATDKINEILAITNISLIPPKIIDRFKHINGKIIPFLQDRMRVELSLNNLLQTGKKVIEQEKMDTCPLCKQKINRNKLLPEIEKRLKILQEMSDKAKEIRSGCVSVIEDMKKISNNLNLIVSKIKVFPELSEQKNALLHELDLWNNLTDRVASAKEFKNEIPIQEISKEIDEINKLVNSISDKCTALLNEIGLTKEEEEVLKNTRLIAEVSAQIKKITTTTSELKLYKKYHKIAEKVFITFSDTKKSKIQELYNSIQGDIQRFYSLLHPNEPHKNIELTITLGRRASTEIKIESFGRHGEDPRALTSEGHLDSLGLCIFLAFVKKFNEDCPLIVLDDIVTTIDANHRSRIAELLLEEFKDYQLIITTHDEIWYKEIINSQRALNVQGNFINMEIVSWDVSVGPKISPYKPRWDRILAKLANNDKTGAGNESRIYLEWLLKEICERLEVPIPFKRNGKYTVAELLKPAEKRIKDKLKDSDLKHNLLDKFTELENTSFMGNLLSHDNSEIDNLSIEEVKTFCNAVHALHQAFLCPECGKFLKYFRESKIVRCPDISCKSPSRGETI